MEPDLKTLLLNLYILRQFAVSSCEIQMRTCVANPVAQLSNLIKVILNLALGPNILFNDHQFLRSFNDIDSKLVFCPKPLKSKFK